MAYDSFSRIDHEKNIQTYHIKIIRYFDCQRILKMPYDTYLIGHLIRLSSYILMGMVNRP